ncbi:MAG TPA: hypothetical protein VGA51_12355 [Casimicrobiaceae bacterium]
MSLGTLLLLVIALAIPLVPVWWLSRDRCTRAQDCFVASQYTRPEVVRNASIAYALPMAVLGPLLAWGANGQFDAVLVAVASVGLGIALLFTLRRRLIEFLDGSLASDGSITVHEFIARQHGGDPRVRALAAVLTLFALLGLLVGEALALAAFLKPTLGAGNLAASVIVFGTLLVVASSAMLAGHSGVMHSGQLQLGMLYLGLFGMATILLYLHVSVRAQMPQHAALALVVIALCAASMLCYRRTRYVDTGPIRGAASNANHERPNRGARALSRFAKILNIWLSFVLAVIIVLALMGLYAVPATARDASVALQSGPRVPAIAFIALCLLPLLHPLVDVVNWQRLAAVRKDMGSGIDAVRQAAVLRGMLRMYAAESALMCLFIGMLGTIAVVALDTQGGTDAPAIIAQLVSGNDALSPIVLPLLLITVFALALSTMTALFSASLCTIHYDLRATVAPNQPPLEPAQKRRTVVTGGTLALGVFALFWLFDTALRIVFTTSTLLGLLFAVCCAQLCFAPLVVGPLAARGRERAGSVSAGWALSIVVAGLASSVVAVAVYFVTGSEAWLWAAVPACLGAGFALFSIAPRRREPPIT